MSSENYTENLAKAKPFFDRAEQVEATDNFDYAIDMYIEGLRRAPDALEDGHITLRHMSFIRQAKNGKKPSIMDKIKHRGGKTPLEQMLNAEFLLSKDPDNLEYIQAMVKAAVAGKFQKTAEWITDLLFDALKANKKETVQTYLLLKDAYKDLGLYEKAVQACSYAVKLKPQDGILADELKYLSANMAMQRGRYDQEGDFRKMIRDKDSQDKLQAQDAVVKTEDYKLTAARDARNMLKNDPEKPENHKKLANALSDLGTNDTFVEAEKILQLAYEKFKDYSLIRLQGDIKIKHIKNLARKARAKIEANPKDDTARADFKSLSEKILKTEIDHFKGCVDNYPTDLKLKYEYANRLLASKRFDEAIPLFQESQRDPKNRIPAMDKLGVCFFNKGWYSDSIDIFNEAIKGYELEDDAIGKDLRYNLARAYEKNGDTVKAFEIYRRLAQLDFGYKDVKARVDALRADKSNGSTSK